MHGDALGCTVCDKLRYSVDRQTRTASGSIHVAADNRSDVTQIQARCKTDANMTYKYKYEYKYKHD